MRGVLVARESASGARVSHSELGMGWQFVNHCHCPSEMGMTGHFVYHCECCRIIRGSTVKHGRSADLPVRRVSKAAPLLGGSASHQDHLATQGLPPPPYPGDAGQKYILLSSERPNHGNPPVLIHASLVLYKREMSNQRTEHKKRLTV